jgi:hypothetical protein
MDGREGEGGKDGEGRGGEGAKGGMMDGMMAREREERDCPKKKYNSCHTATCPGS